MTFDEEKYSVTGWRSRVPALKTAPIKFSPVATLADG